MAENVILEDEVCECYGAYGEDWKQYCSLVLDGQENETEVSE